MTTRAAAAWLAFGILRRLLREGMVLRSLLFPGALAIGTALTTVVITLFVQPAPTLGVTAAGRTAAIEVLARDEGIRLVAVDNPDAALDAGTVHVVLDSDRLYVRVAGIQPLEPERIARKALGGRWIPEPAQRRARTERRGGPAQRALMQLIAVLYGMYGVVFGAGGIARDRAEGTLDAELTLGIPFWVHGLVRWGTGTALLGGAMTVTALLFAATVGSDAPWEASLQGTLAGSAGTAIGLLAVGGGSLERGFAASLSLGVSTILAALGLAFTAPTIARYVPVSSVWVDAPTWEAIPVTFLLAALAVVSVARRTAVS